MSNVSDLTNWYNSAISGLHAVDTGDFEVEGALNAAVTALKGLVVAADRAKARQDIAKAKRVIANAEATLKTVEEPRE